MSDALLPEGAPEDLAAELALGVLDGAERAAAERRVLADPKFAGEVEAWSNRLAKLAEEAESREAPASVWPRIEAQLGSAAGKVVELKLRRSLAVWRSVAGAAGAVAAGLAVVLLLPRPVPPAPAAPTVAAAPASAGLLETASLSTKAGGKIAFVAIYDVERRELVLTPASIGTSPGRSPELWVIPAGGKPISLGVGQFGKPVRLKVDALTGGDLASTLAVSLEPLGGSPTGQPTGPVVATGQLQKL